jgi:LemA protein
MNKTLGIIIALVVVIGIWAISSYNSLISQQEQVSQAWGQVQTTYQRRLDLIPNLVATVQGYAAHEKSTLVDVTNARARATQSLQNATPENQAQLNQLTQSQAALSGALGRLMVVVERYPDLKASENFLALQSQLEGTENRIAVARERYNDAVQTYNVTLRHFPANLIANMTGFHEKAYFAADAQAAQAPKVSFS